MSKANVPHPRGLRTPLALLALLAGCAPSPQVAAPAQSADSGAVAAVRQEARPLGGPGDYDALMELVGDARVVLIGEASHGTHEFYRERARITRRLIEEKGFNAVAIEGDWPDAYRVNRFVRGMGEDTDGRLALSDFERFPTWMWRNTDVLEFTQWLRTHNATRPAEQRAGFYGLDVYSLFSSMTAVTDYLQRVDPAAAARARDRYRCFARHGEDPVAYGQAVESRAGRSCQAAVGEQLREMERRAALTGEEGEALYAAMQNARAVVAGEEYYRSMFLRGVSTWNLRDRYMMETLEGLMRRLGTAERPARVVVWAHNSHVGDARATHMGDQGELNIGQLARQRWGQEAVLIGFTTYTGTVMAASDWGGPAERKRVRPSLPGSYGDLFHQVGIPSFLLTLRNSPAASAALRPARLERAIGVIYLPQSERVSHYFHAVLPAQFDAVIHIDETTAVEPLPGARAGSAADTGPHAARG